MERMLRVHGVKFAGPGFSSMSPERRKKARSGLRKRSARWRAKSRKTADWVGTQWECCWQAMRCREGWILDVVRLMLCRISNGVTIQHNDIQVTGEHRLYTRVNRSPLRDTKQRSITKRRWALPTVSAKMGQDHY